VAGTDLRRRPGPGAACSGATAWSHTTARARSAGEVVDAAGPGAILLAHDGGRIDGPNPQRIDRSRTVQSLPLLLAGLERRRLRTVTLPQLLREGTPV